MYKKMLQGERHKTYDYVHNKVYNAFCSKDESDNYFVLNVIVQSGDILAAELTLDKDGKEDIIEIDKSLLKLEMESLNFL